MARLEVLAVVVALRHTRIVLEPEISARSHQLKVLRVELQISTVLMQLCRQVEVAAVPLKREEMQLQGVQVLAVMESPRISPELPSFMEVVVAAALVLTHAEVQPAREAVARAGSTVVEVAQELTGSEAEAEAPV